MYAYYLIVIKLEDIIFPLTCLFRRSEPGVGKSVFHYTVLASAIYEGPLKDAMPCGKRLHASTPRILARSLFGPETSHEAIGKRDEQHCQSMAWNWTYEK